MVQIHDRDLLSVTAATRKGVSGLIAEAQSGRDIILARHSKPVAAVISMQRLGELQELREDLGDLAVVLSRMATDTGRRSSLDEVLAAFGDTREELEALAGDDS